SMAAFLEACGQSRPLDLQVEDLRSSEVRRWVFHQPFILAGRGARADLPLHAAEVSQRHAYLQMIAGRLLCLDLHSRTGTHWDWGSSSIGWLDPNQVIQIGPFRLSGGPPFPSDSRPEDNPLAACPPEEDNLPA